VCFEPLIILYKGIEDKSLIIEILGIKGKYSAKIGIQSDLNSISIIPTQISQELKFLAYLLKSAKAD
jgi:hypothetical protein